MNWLYNNKSVDSIEDLGESTIFGFIYKITCNVEIDGESGRFYIGKKQIMSNTNVKLGKKELALLPTQRGRKVTKKKVTKESNWLNYWGSNKFLLEDVKKYGAKNFTKEILILTYNKKSLTYYEMAIQCKYDVLTVNSYNDNINGRHFRKDFVINNLPS